MTEISILLAKMEKNDYSGFEYGDLDRVLVADSKRGIELIWRSLLTLDNLSVPGCASLCLDLWHALRKTTAVDEARLLQQWPSLAWTARANVCYALAVPELLSSNLGIALFNHPASTVEDRHMIAGELYRVTLLGLLDKTVVLDLLSRIGRYEDEAAQKRLNRFVHALEEEFQTAPALA